MKNDEFAFFNQQLAAMVRDGIPLESAMQRLCADMRQGPMRAELEKLREDLAKGTPLREAVKARQLPELYKQMLQVGAESNDLSGVLTMLADHYQRRHVVVTRLKGLMVYPAIVLVAAFLLSCFLCVLVMGLTREIVWSQPYWWGPLHAPMLGMLLSPLLLGIAIIGAFIAIGTPGIRSALRWKLPAFREASVAQVASALTLMLRSGVPLNSALGLSEELERGTPAEAELSRWRQRLAVGKGKFSEMAEESKLFPPLFVWTVSQAHEDLAGGFQRASEVFQARANYRTELLLYSALPCSVMLLGTVVLLEVQPLISILNSFMQAMSDVGK
jgi:type II secretory pathway component PulF